MLDFIADQEKMVRFQCKNLKCYFATTDKQKLFNHEQSCRSKTQITCKQIAMGKPDHSARRSLILEGIIPDEDWHNWHFCCYDVESFMAKLTNEQGLPRNAHRLVSIAVKSSFGYEKYIERKNMNPIEVQSMMKEFHSYLCFLREEMLKVVPASVTDGLKKYEQLVRSEEFKSFSVVQQAKDREKLRYLTNCLQLRIYSWNGERYDNNIIWAPLLDVCQFQKYDFERMNIIRRGTGLMQFSIGNLVFRDFLNYSNPMKLEDFAKSCGLPEREKTAFPYEHYHDISELRTLTEFPPYSVFRSCLANDIPDFRSELIQLINANFAGNIWKDHADVMSFFQFSSDLIFEYQNGELQKIETQGEIEISSILHTSPQKYHDSKMIFIEKCSNMSDYLNHYNKNDVIILEDCIRTYAAGVFDTWKVNLHEKMSLPGLSQGKFKIIILSLNYDFVEIK